MSTPPDRMMELIKNQQKGAGAPGAAPGAMPDAPPVTPEALPGQAMSGMSDQSTPPMSSPMSTPEPKMGNREGALVNIGLAMDLIEQSLPSLGSESPEGQKALAALRTLTGLLGPRKAQTKELQQSEIIQMLQNLPQAGGGTPAGQAMAQAPVIPNMPPMPGAGAGGPQPPQM